MEHSDGKLARIVDTWIKLLEILTYIEQYSQNVKISDSFKVSIKKIK